MKRNAKWLPWAIGALTALALFAGLWVVGGLRYENSDDMLFVKGFMGFEGGEPVSFTLYTHTFLAWILYGLSKLVPQIAWFSVLQVALLCVSVASILATSVRQHGVKGYLVGCAFLAVAAPFACARLSYTTTAAMAGAACVWQLVSLRENESKGQLPLAIVLFLCAYSLRQMVALPILAYCLLALCWQGAKRWKAGKTLHPVIVATAMLCGLLLAFAGVREAEISLRGQRETLTWQKSRIELFDYTSFEQDISPALEADSGLTNKQAALVQQWHFWDTDVDAEAFQALTAAYANEEKESVLTKLTAFLQSNPRYVCFCALLLLALLWIVLCDGRGLAALAALLALAGGGVMLIYLCWRGRVLFRGLDTVFFPCGALLCALTLTLGKPKRKALSAVLCAALVLAVGVHACLTLDVLREKPDWVSQQREAEFEAFALQHPDKLVVRTPNLLRDTRLFPDVSADRPENTAIWGDWYCRMPGWHRQLRQFGLDDNAFTLADWTNEVLVFAATEEAPPTVLTDAISEDLGREVICELYGEEGTLRFYQFH